MAGQKAGIAERVREIEAEAVGLAYALLMAVPQRYRVKPINMNDPSAVAWMVAVDKMTKAAEALEGLGDLVGEPGHIGDAVMG